MREPMSILKDEFEKLKRERNIYSLESKVGRLYQRVMEETLKKKKSDNYILGKDDPKLDDIVIKGDGITLIGECGCSGDVYRWHPTTSWVEVQFKTDKKVSPSEFDKLLDALENYFGKATYRIQLEPTQQLKYYIPIGERKVIEVYHDGTKKEKDEVIVGTMIMEIDTLPSVSF